MHAGAASLIADGSDKPVVDPGQTGDRATDGTLTTLFGKSLMFLDYQDWETGTPRRVSVSLSYRPAQLYRHLSDAQQIVFGGRTLGEWAVVILLLIAVLFLTIEVVALGMGLALARSITSSIHELFMGTERVRHGDFAHRIDVSSNDQLGELAGSFNQMTGSIEGLLQTAAEKKRLEEELRIARVIQMSLLPTRAARRPRPRHHGIVRAGARGWRGLLRLLPPVWRPARRADCRRLGKGHVGGALHGGAERAGARAQPALRLAARAADRGQSHHLGTPRQPELHHHDLRGHRRASGA